MAGIGLTAVLFAVLLAIHMIRRRLSGAKEAKILIVGSLHKDEHDKKEIQKVKTPSGPPTAKQEQSEGKCEQ